MKPTPPGGVLLLDADTTARILGDRFGFLTGRGFIGPVGTSRGPCYREDEVLELRDAIDAATAPAGGISVPVTGRQAAYILGVGTETVRRAAAAGLLTRDERGWYDSAEVRLLHGARQGKALRLRA